MRGWGELSLAVLFCRSRPWRLVSERASWRRLSFAPSDFINTFDIMCAALVTSDLLKCFGVHLWMEFWSVNADPVRFMFVVQLKKAKTRIQFDHDLDQHLNRGILEAITCTHYCRWICCEPWVAWGASAATNRSWVLVYTPTNHNDHKPYHVHNA